LVAGLNRLAESLPALGRRAPLIAVPRLAAPHAAAMRAG
jgi:hypothetical protein